MRLLLPRRLGFPLWMPQPHRNLPSEYRRNGVSIGDVGIVTSGGIFDFLFNICLPSNHCINGGSVPDGFVPLEPPKPVDIIDHTLPCVHIAGGSIDCKLRVRDTCLPTCLSPRLLIMAP